MSVGKVSKSAVDKLPTGQFLWDTEVSGFGVKANTNGSKSYIFQYRMGGRSAPTKRFTIGRHGNLTPDQARDIAKKLAAKVVEGVDPVARERADRDAVREAQAATERADRAARLYTIAKLSERFVTEAVDQRSHRFVRSAFVAHIIPKLGTTPLPSLDRALVRDLLAELATPSIRRSVFTTMSWFCNWAKEQDIIEASPMAGLKPPPPVAARDRVLDEDELALVWRAAGALPYPFGPFYRLLMLTGQRREEVAGLQWSEVDRAKRLWTLPAERAKNGNTNSIPLSDAAIDQFDTAAGVHDKDVKRWPRAGFVFTKNNHSSISGFSNAKIALDAKIVEIAEKDAKESGAEELATVAPWRIHDLRRTLATGFQQMHVRFEVTEAVLNHVEKARGGVAGIYQRHHWNDEKRLALEQWAARIASLAQPTDHIRALPVHGAQTSSAA